MAKSIEVVVIHGSHKSADGIVPVGESVTLGVAELKSLDPQFSFKKGIGERFATPEAAKKLNLKRQLEDELDAVDTDEIEDGEEAEGAAESAPAEAPAAKPKGKKRKG